MQSAPILPDPVAPTRSSARPPSLLTRAQRDELALKYLPIAAQLRPAKPENVKPASRIVLFAFQMAEAYGYWSDRFEHGKAEESAGAEQPAAEGGSYA